MFAQWHSKRRRELPLETLLHEMGHVLGKEFGYRRVNVKSNTLSLIIFLEEIGSNWDDKKLVSGAQYPYVGVNANREYREVSGCYAVPLEKEAAKGAPIGKKNIYWINS